MNSKKKKNLPIQEENKKILEMKDVSYRYKDAAKDDYVLQNTTLESLEEEAKKMVEAQERKCIE